MIKEDYYFGTFRDLLKKQVKKLSKNSLYYEVWCDIDEQFEKWFDYMYKYPNLAAYTIAKWMIKRDKWYWSPKYIAELNKAMQSSNSASKAFTKVLENSLK